MAHMAREQQEGKQLFKLAAAHAFEEWDVVSKARDQQWGEEDTEEKVEWMKDVVAEWFYEIPDDPPNEEEVSWYICEILTNEFSVLDDGSLGGDLAVLLVNLFRKQAENKLDELRSFCEAAEARRAKADPSRRPQQKKQQPQEQQARREQHQQQQQQLGKGMDEGDDDDDGNTAQAQGDDGWTTVTAKKGGKKKGKRKGGAKAVAAVPTSHDASVAPLQSDMQGVRLSDKAMEE